VSSGFYFILDWVADVWVFLAVESRKKKKEEVQEMQMSLKEREAACVLMEERCKGLENE
jgi:hypothetical protein